VTADQIDHLGHMNVWFYTLNARAGAEQLLGELGVAESASTALVQHDTYVRHHHEQLEGSKLEVRGGVLDVTGDRIRLYEELVNTDSGALAATFILGFGLADRTTRTTQPLPPDAVAAAGEALVEVPEHGRPRSVSPDDDVIGGAPSLDVLEERDLAHRQVRTITAEECDEDGFVMPLMVAALVWGGEPTPGRAFQPLHELADGGQMGFATMETRATWGRIPRVGDRVQSFGAEVERGAKTMLTRNWVYDVDRRDLVAVFSVVNVAFNTATRRAMELPADIRARWESRLHPDLG
jgi:acyl-CoA thioester hydrolase